MSDNSAKGEADMIAETERYIAEPGQALCYKMGAITIKELRDKAKKMLGSKFDLRFFHNEILKDGAMPLAIVEGKIDSYICHIMFRNCKSICCF